MRPRGPAQGRGLSQRRKTASSRPSLTACACLAIKHRQRLLPDWQVDRQRHRALASRSGTPIMERGGSNASLTMRRTNRLGGMVLTRRFVGRVRRRARSSTTTTPTAPPAASTLIRQASGRRVAAASAAVRAAGWAVATPANAVAARAHSLSSPATRRHRPADLFLLLVGGAGRDPRIRIQEFEFIIFSL